MKKAKQTAQLDFGLLVLDPEKHRIEAQHKQRKCLSRLSDACQGTFMSHGPGNRICPICTNILNGWPAGLSEVSVSGTSVAF